MDFLDAILYNDIEKVYSFLQSQPEYLKSLRLEYPMHLAVDTGDLFMVGLLLKYGANVNETSPDGSTLLHLAIYWGDKEMVELLIRHGASVNVINHFGKSPVDKVMEMILTRNDEEYSAYCVDLLYSPVKKTDIEILRLLVEAGADVTVKQSNGQTLMHLPVVLGNTELARTLLEAGAPINEKDKDGNTPLHWAMTFQNEHVIELLLKFKADLDAKNHLGFSATDYAVNHGNGRIIKLLAKYVEGFEEKYKCSGVVDNFVKGNGRKSLKKNKNKNKKKASG